MTRPEETLDPSDWPALRALGHRMVDDMMDYLEQVRERPVWRSVPAETRAALDEPLPRGPTDTEEVYQQFREHILPYPTGNIHPRFWGWVMGTGTPLAMLADMLASGMNAHLAGYDQSPAMIERQVIRWMAELLGFPVDASGLLVSGGTVANLVGLAVARNVGAGYDIRADGLQREARRASCSTARARPTAGPGRRASCWAWATGRFRRIPVSPAYEVDVAALRAAIAADRAAGHRPFCVIGNAGTVNTGATDDLRALAALCREERLWFHVDGAFGAFAALAPSLRAIGWPVWSRPTRIAVDLHKWGYLPFEVGLALVRHPDAHRATFAAASSYLDPTPRGIVAGGLPFAELGMQLSRGFRALKVWMSLKSHGSTPGAGWSSRTWPRRTICATASRASRGWSCWPRRRSTWSASGSWPRVWMARRWTPSTRRSCSGCRSEGLPCPRAPCWMDVSRCAWPSPTTGAAGRTSISSSTPCSRRARSSRRTDHPNRRGRSAHRDAGRSRRSFA